MFVISRKTVIHVNDAKALREVQPMPFGIACIVGGPCAEPYNFALLAELGEQGFPRVGVWVGSNPDCFVENYSADMAHEHAERAIQDANRAGMHSMPMALDVHPTGDDIDAQTEYAITWCDHYASVGGHPWVYSSHAMCTYIQSQRPHVGVWYPTTLASLAPDAMTPHSGVAWRITDELPFATSDLTFSFFADEDVVQTMVVANERL